MGIINKLLNKTVDGANSAIIGSVNNFSKVVIGFKIAKILIPTVIVMVLLALVWNEVAGGLTASASSSISDTISSSGSTALNNNYKKSGSLVLANNNDVKQISTNYLDNISKGDLNYAQKLLESKIAILNTNNSGVYLETSTGVDPIDLGEDFTLSEHILNTERYNFNRITWGKYIRGVNQSSAPTLTVDPNTRLQYPIDDEYDLEKFTSMARPYLQTWLIPMSMFSGVVTDTTNDNFANFAYQIISEGYHKITIDQHSLDTKTRVNKYAIYDKTTTQVYVDRTCTTYKKGNNQIEVCVDAEVLADSVEEKNVRENISSIDTIATNYSYVVSSVQTFDYSFEKTYKFEPYYNDTNNYNEDTSKADSYTQTEGEYNKKEEVIDSNFVKNTKLAPQGVDLSSYNIVSSNTKRYKYKTVVEKVGIEHTDTIVWSDNLGYDFENSTSKKGYTVQQLEEYLGSNANLSTDEKKYYEALEQEEELNLIDFLNANEDIYNTYTHNPLSENIGYQRSYLVTSYDVLKQNLSDLYSDYNSTIYYGQSVAPEITSGSMKFYDYSVLANGSFGWPLEPSESVKRLSSCTGLRVDPVAGTGSENHAGDDIPAPKGTAILAAKDGTVIRSVLNRTKGYGTYILLEHADGWYTIYGHMDYDIMAGVGMLEPGTHVMAGQVIGYVGTTGKSTGNHLHFEIRFGDPGLSYYEYLNLPKLEPMLYIDTSTIPQSIYDENDGGANNSACPDQEDWGIMIKNVSTNSVVQNTTGN